MGIIAHGLTHIGMKRKTNQDAIYLDEKNFFYVVADGMGGHKGGDIASALATKHLPENFFATKIDENEKIEAKLSNSVQYTNKFILNESQKNPDLKGMGTTVTTAFFHKSNLYIANVGDSRAYLISNGELYQMTRDHSLVQEKINLGIYTREDAVKDLMKNVLVRTVGYEPEVEVDVFSYKVSRKDIFLLCSDGLHGKVSDKDILTIVKRHTEQVETVTKENIKSAAQELIDLANHNGGNDNISVILFTAQ